jgi:hypothetical protein
MLLSSLVEGCRKRTNITELDCRCLLYFRECTLDETFSEQWIRDIHHSPVARTLNRDPLSQPETWSLYVDIGITPGEYASPTTDYSHYVGGDRGLGCSFASI